ncbi:sugar transferase [Williamsia sterculiae]|uniref:Exopolysaccharide biosynthesis polyprenyl glycosylphosphotransferase n=1 Tax=Williamsia sterculiae TaxID=1344003 RepID=A0A1N7CIW4_9NOCA|nr:sugar transferase [Williamsia sterculiae]SIR63463.1 exopolysaccharide biosynthesis polyprenyl glycosylphosphotransferase [Williamsia sterculiae]
MGIRQSRTSLISRRDVRGQTKSPESVVAAASVTGGPAKTRHRTDGWLMALDFVAVTLVLVVGTTQWLPPLEAAVFVVVLQISGIYRRKLTLSSLNDLPRLIGSVIIATWIVVLIFDQSTPMLRAFLEALATSVLLFVIRALYYALQRRRRRLNVRARSRTAIVGGGKVAAKLLESIAEYPELGLEPVVVYEHEPLDVMTDYNIPIERRNRPLRETVIEHEVQTLLVAFSYTRDSDFVSPLRECDELDCEIFLVPRLFEFVHLSGEMDRVHTVPLIRVRRDALRTWQWRLKRIFDLTMALTAMIVFSPLLVGTALAVKLSDRSAPIIFKQIRIGRKDQPFELYKFRSMKPVPATTSDVDWNPNRDDRLGPVGRFIRKVSLDELPQLWNVVRGDMSIVGPRPERPHFVEQFGQSVRSYSDRHRVGVGLTGWAAIHGLRGDTSIDDRAMYDNFYIENWSVWLDIKIIILTVGALLRGTGS